MCVRFVNKANEPGMKLMWSTIHKSTHGWENEVLLHFFVSVYDAFEHWKALVTLLCSCEEALCNYTDLFTSFICESLPFCILGP